MPTPEEEEWERFKRAGAVRSRARTLRVVGIVSVGLALAAASMTSFNRIAVGSRKKAGEACEFHGECASYGLCFESECMPTCEHDLRCPEGRGCVRVLTTRAKYGQQPYGEDLKALCVHEEDAPSYRAHHDDGLHGP